MKAFILIALVAALTAVGARAARNTGTSVVQKSLGRIQAAEAEALK